MTGMLDRMGRWLSGGPGQAGLADPADIHISQVGDEMYNQYAPGATANCGPAAVIMAIRMVGGRVPGEGSFSGEGLIEHVRRLATGSTDRLRGTNNLHLQRVLEQAGCRSRVLTHPKDMLRAVMRGEPVIMGGNPTVRGGYCDRFDYIDIRRWDSGHWILVSAWDRDRRMFVVNDPQSTIGPIHATAQELYAFNSRDGNFGLAVSRA